MIRRKGTTETIPNETSVTIRIPPQVSVIYNPELMNDVVQAERNIVEFALVLPFYILQIFLALLPFAIGTLRLQTEYEHYKRTACLLFYLIDFL